MTTCRLAAKISNTSDEATIISGTKGTRKAGRGSEPSTLSTPIFKGSGINKASGVANSCNKKINQLGVLYEVVTSLK